MPLNGNGKCFECDNGDWYCPGENGDGEEECPEGGGMDWEEVGIAWLPIDMFRKHGFKVFVRVHCRENGTHRVDTWLKPVIEETPLAASLAARPIEREVEIMRVLADEKWLVKIEPKKRERKGKERKKKDK